MPPVTGTPRVCPVTSLSFHHPLMAPFLLGSAICVMVKRKAHSTPSQLSVRRWDVSHSLSRVETNSMGLFSWEPWRHGAGAAACGSPRTHCYPVWMSYVHMSPTYARPSTMTFVITVPSVSTLTPIHSSLPTRS